MRSDQLAVMDTLDRRELEERQTAVRALLRHPLLGSGGPDPNAFILVRRHARWLCEWFMESAGWRLRVDNGLARLHKILPRAIDTTRPAVADRGSGVPFSRRRYALLCLALAVLERADAQVTLGQLAERVVSMVAEPAVSSTGLLFTIGSADERRDLVAVVRLLQGLGVLAQVAGDELDFVNGRSSGDALYDVDRRALGSLLVSPRGASLVNARTFEARLGALVDELAPDTQDAQRRAVRHGLVRRLLEDPVVYVDDLTEEEQSYFISQRPFLVRRVCEATGWVAEMRAEGVALLDPTGEATDLRMPEEGTDGHATLLLAEHLAGQLQEHGPAPISLSELHKKMLSWTREHNHQWRKGTRDQGAEVALVAMALSRLNGLGLVQVTPEGVAPRAALARFEYRPAVVQVAQDLDDES
jgi:uncharacterized protein (TIGR02678 family)